MKNRRSLKKKTRDRCNLFYNVKATNQKKIVFKIIPRGFVETGKASFNLKNMLKIAKVRDVETPNRGTFESAGLDFYVPNDFFPSGSIVLLPHQSALIPSGIHAQIPKGFALIMFNKSGLAFNKDFKVGACVIDEDYQGEIHLHVTNTGMSNQRINNGQKLVQGILIPVNYAEVLEVDFADLYKEETERGNGGFGSTGLK